MFLSCLATDIVVGLGSWVESDAQKVENTKTETDDQLEVLKWDNMGTENVINY